MGVGNFNVAFTVTSTMASFIFSSGFAVVSFVLSFAMFILTLFYLLR
jgi:hypothetical protein